MVRRELGVTRRDYGPRLSGSVGAGLSGNDGGSADEEVGGDVRLRQDLPTAGRFTISASSSRDAP
ncbi:MAG: hypothetical protein ACYTF0_06295, partial [Planctomycetota bacterium]